MALSPEERRERRRTRAAAKYKADPAKYLAIKRDEYARNPEKFRQKLRNRSPEDRKRYAETQQRRLTPELVKKARARRASKINATKRRWRLINRDGLNAKDRARRAAKGDGIRARDRDRYHASPARKERNKRWALNNPEATARRDRHRYASERQAEGRHAAQDIQDLYARQQGLCAGCARPVAKRGPDKYHVDHYLALSRGGTNWPANLQLLCRTCNCSKGNASPEQWETVIKPRCIERRRTRDG